MSRVWVLLGQRVRRDRGQLTMWIVGTAALAYLSYVGVAESFGTEQERGALIATALANPVILLFRGLPSGVEQSAVMVFLVFPWLAMLAGFMSSFLAVRHTRGEEEPGRAELVSATAAGRTAPTVATALHGLLANALLAALTAGAFLLTGSDAEGSLLVGVAAGAVGVVFLGVGMFTAQLMRTSRGANAAAVWVLLVSFVLCGIGNAIGTPNDDLTRMQSSWLAWLSPFGWGENTRAFDANTWWPVALCLAAALTLSGVSVALTAARDLGGSFVAERRGRTTAPASLSSPTGLVWRLTRASISGWAVGGLLVGVLSTTLAGIVEEIGADNPAIEQILAQISGGGSLEQATVTTFFTMLGILAACCAVQIVCRARQEEAHGTAEPVLATVVGRVHWLTGYLVIALAGLVAVVFAGAAGSLLGVVVQEGDDQLVKTVLVAAAGQMVAASVFLAATALVFVLAPRLTIPLGWTLVVLGMVIGLFGPLFGMPEWLTNLSPIAIAPVMQGDEVDVQGLWWLMLATGVGAAASTWLMRRRELAAGG